MARIMTQGHATAAHLADHLGLTQAAVRRHLATLQAQGLVEVRQQRSYASRSVGRPSKAYQPTNQGRAQFDNAYDELAIEVLEHLRQLGGNEAVEGFAEHKFAAIEASYLALRQAEPGLTAVEALSQVLSQSGFMADLAPIPSGDQLRQHHCPYQAVAARFPQFCQAETAAFARLLDSHVQRLATIAHGDGICTTHVPKPISIKEEM
jgi:predicted ArsR family transcriptional regulator